MGRAQFEYDEVGNTFYYVIVSFFAVILFPLTHFLWPSLPKRPEVIKRGCRCEGDLVKRFKKEQIKPWEKAKCVIKGAVLAILWALFILLAYKVSQLEQHFEEYDPYKILQLDAEADVSEIKKKYRELSKLHHPDRPGGDAVLFDNIVKAYKALTDDESRENWRLYGNPDGPKATTFGIALPKWIVSEQYGGWVLGFYALIFMIILPVSVGLWWYNSIKYSADKVLLETTRLYYYFMGKTPNMEINRIIMVLAGSFEFWKKFNTEVVERETDDVEVPRVMKELRNLGENKKEAPFCHPWSIKARTLIHAHLSRIELFSTRLEADQHYMVGRSLLLAEEFLRVLLQMMQMPIQRQPSVDCMENMLRTFPMLVQALWPRNSSLLQLPHISEQNIAYLRKNRVVTCQDVARLNEFRRRALLNTVTKDQYEDIIYVLTMMPRLEIETKIEVQGEDDKETVTVGSVVTLKVTLRRFALLDVEKRREEIAEGPTSAERPAADREEDEEQQQQQNKRKVWEKQPKKKAKKGGPKQGAKGKKAPQKAAEAPQTSAVTAPTKNNVADSPKRKLKRAEKRQQSDEEDNSEESDGGSTKNEDESNNSEEDESGGGDKSDYEMGGQGGASNEDDDPWNDDEDEEGLVRKRDMLLDSEPVTHHEVHCPHYPGDKYEWWYLYMVERKSRRLVTMVVPCKTLDQEKTVELRFSAPPQAGLYYFALHVRSDSYMDADYAVDVNMRVHPAREPPQVRYEDTEEEEKDEEEVSSTDEYTEGSSSEQEDD